jgi:hypothetical protein
MYSSTTGREDHDPGDGYDMIQSEQHLQNAGFICDRRHTNYAPVGCAYVLPAATTTFLPPFHAYPQRRPRSGGSGTVVPVLAVLLYHYIISHTGISSAGYLDASPRHVTRDAGGYGEEGEQCHL